MRDGNRILPAVAYINPAMEASGTERTVAALAIVHRRIPDMRGVGGTLPPHALARIVGDIVGGERPVLRRMPGGGEFGGFPAQRTRVKGLVVPCAHGEAAPPAARALAIAGFDGCAPDMVRILMTLPPHRLGTIGRAPIEREQSVLRRMPFAGEVWTSKAEGRRRAYRRGPS